MRLLFSAFVFSLLYVTVARAEDTVADYFAHDSVTKARYAEKMVEALRPNHPALTARQLSACLDDIAKFRENRQMHLRAAVTICAAMEDR